MDTFILFVLLCTPGEVGACDMVYTNHHYTKVSCTTELKEHTLESNLYNLEVRGVCVKQNVADYCESSVDPQIESDRLYAACMDYYETDGME